MIREAEHRAVIVFKIPVTSVLRAIRRPDISARLLIRARASPVRDWSVKCATDTDRVMK